MSACFQSKISVCVIVVLPKISLLLLWKRPASSLIVILIVLIIIALLGSASGFSFEVQGNWLKSVGCVNSFEGRVAPLLFADGVAELPVFAILVIIFYNKQ